MSFNFSYFAILIIFGAYAEVPCDEYHGRFCPEDSGWGVGECLKKVEKDSISSSCLAHIELHDACKIDIEKRCNENAYTDYVLACLTEWTQRADLEPSCAALLPEKKAKEAKEISAESKKRAAARRRIRNNAVKMARTKKTLDDEVEDDDGL